MSAMGAAELPEVPAALPQDSARNRAVARWAGAAEPTPAAIVPVPSVPAERLPVPAERLPVPAERLPIPAERLPIPAVCPEPPRRLAGRPQLARDQAARDQAAHVPLRLTRRGRIVVAVATALLLAALSLVIAASAQATNHAPSGAAQRNLTQVTVRPGQSLWSVAENADPDADTRMVVQQIIELNGLTGNVVFAGQRLWVPRG